MSNGILMGNLTATGLASVVVDLPSVTNAQTADVAVTVNGARTGDFVSVSATGLTTGLVVANGVVTDTNEVTFQVANVSAAPIDESAATFNVFWARSGSSNSTFVE